MSADDRLACGLTVEQVLALDEADRQREAAQRQRGATEAEDRQFDTYMASAYGIEPEKRPEPSPDPKPDPHRDPDLHAGARQSTDHDGDAFDVYFERSFGRS
jgi:hypothetical protein